MIVRGLRVFGFLLVVAGHAFGNSTELDLERQEPVPADSPIPISDFFRPVYMSGPSINLAGSHVAALVTGGSEKPQLMIIDLKKGDREVVAGRIDRQVYAHQWLGNDHIAFKISRDKRFDYGLMVARLKRLDKPYPIFQFGLSRIVGIPRDSPLKPFVWVRSAQSRRSTGLYQLNAKLDMGPLVDLRRASTGAERERVNESNQRHIIKNFPAPPGDDDTSYITDGRGELMAAFSIRGAEFTGHLWEEDEWKPVSVDLDETRLLSSGDKWGEMIAQPDLTDGQQSEVRFYDLETGEWGEALLGHDGYDFNGSFYRDRKSHKIVGAQFQRAGPAVQWFDERYARLQEMLDGAFPKRVAQIAHADENRDNVVVRVFSDRLPVEYYLVNLKRKSVDLIAKSRPWIDPVRMRPMNVIQYKTAEGFKLDAYVTMPEGATKENPPPLLVIPHGGPWARDHWGFDAQAQFWASRGYAVIQPNYRGSTGYDWKYSLEDRYDFLKMHDDVTRAARTLIRSGYADPDRVAIMGASFGGYLALSGVVHESDLYQCALTFAGVFDWETVLAGARSEFQRGRYAILKKRIGDPKKQVEKFERISPIKHLDQVIAPVFVAHGKEDKTALVGESKRLIRGLKEHGIKHESWLISNEAHGTAELANQVELISRMEAFLAEHL